MVLCKQFGVCVNSGRENLKYIALNFRKFVDFVGDTSGRRVPNN